MQFLESFSEDIARKMASSRQQMVLQGHIQRLAKIRRKQPLHPIALVASSVCGTLLDRTEDELSQFKANVAGVASWIIFFDENPRCVNENVAKKIRKNGHLCDRLATGERLVDGETTRRAFSLRRKAVNLDDVNLVIVRRLDQFNVWWGKEYDDWKAKGQLQGTEGGTPSTGDDRIEAHPKLDDKESPKNKAAAVSCRSSTLEVEGRQSRTGTENLPGKHDDEIPKTTTARETNSPASRSKDSIRSTTTELPPSSERTRHSSLVADSSFSEVTLDTATFNPPSTTTNLTELRNPRLSRQSDPTLARTLTPADNVLDFASHQEPAPQDDNISDFLDAGLDDPEDTEYDFLIHHEPEDEEEVESIRNQMQRLLKDKHGNTAKVCIPGDFHYKGLRPNPLLAAVEKCTSVAFFISKHTGDMCRKESILSSLDFLMTTAKKQHIKTIFVLVRGNKGEAEALLRNDNPYLQTTATAGAVYDLDGRDFSKKMSQLFRENQHLTLARRSKSLQPHSSRSTGVRSEMGRPVTRESVSISEKQDMDAGPPPTYSESVAVQVFKSAIVEKLQTNMSNLLRQNVL